MLVNLKIRIYESGLHSYQVAAAVGVPASVLSEIVYERRKATPELRRKLAACLNAPQNWLFAHRRRRVHIKDSGRSIARNRIHERMHRGGGQCVIDGPANEG